MTHAARLNYAQLAPKAFMGLFDSTRDERPILVRPGPEPTLRAGR